VCSIQCFHFARRHKNNKNSMLQDETACIDSSAPALRIITFSRFIIHYIVRVHNKQAVLPVTPVLELFNNVIQKDLWQLSNPVANQRFSLYNAPSCSMWGPDVSIPLVLPTLQTCTQNHRNVLHRTYASNST
jgi:hypothetical protein